MAGYQGGADATVIQAARSAYTIPQGYNASPWDYEGYVNGIANLASFVVGKVNAANERASSITSFEDEINKEFWSANNTDYFTDLKGRMAEASKTMNMSLPFTKKYKAAEIVWSNGMASLDKIKKDEAALEVMIKRVKECSGPNQSSWNNPMLKSLMEEINGSTGMFDHSVKFTDDGIVVMGPDGKETLLEDLPNVASKADGLATTDFINKQGNDAITLKANGDWNDRNRHLMKQSLKAHLDAQPTNIIGSAAFDYKHWTKDGEMSFADHLMATSGPYNEAFENWKNGKGGIGASEKVIQETKMSLAQQLWDDNELMKDEFANWLTSDVLGYQIGGTKVKSTSKTKTETTTAAEETRDGGSDETSDVTDLSKYVSDGSSVNFDWISQGNDAGKFILDYDDEDLVVSRLNDQFGDLFTFEASEEHKNLFGYTDMIKVYVKGRPTKWMTFYTDRWSPKDRIKDERRLIKWLKETYAMEKYFPKVVTWTPEMGKTK